MTYPILPPTSLPPSADPAMRINMQATILSIKVTRRTSHSWYRRVISGCESAGISSAIEWKIRGKTVDVLRR